MLTSSRDEKQENILTDEQPDQAAGEQQKNIEYDQHGQMDEEEFGFDLLSNASEHKEEVIDIDEMEIDVDHCNVDVLFSTNNPDLWDCTFCFQKFESSNRLRRHLILDHFAEKMCHDYCIESGLLGDGYSSSIWASGINCWPAICRMIFAAGSSEVCKVEAIENGEVCIFLCRLR
jgi:hypothetical protein